MLFFTRVNAARTALLLGAGLSFATPLWAQDLDFTAASTIVATAPLQAALADGGVPLEMKVAALDGKWRRFKPIMTGGNYDGCNNSAEFLTREETLNVGTQTFMVAYRFSTEKRDRDERDGIYMGLVPAGGQPDALFNTPDGYGRLLKSDVLRLCLFNVASISQITEMRAFDVAADVIDNPTLSAPDQSQILEQVANKTSVSNLKQIGLALLQYTQDYDEKLPPMRSIQKMADIKNEFNTGWSNAKPSKVQPLLGPYIRNAKIFAHPTTREIYRPNLNLSGRSLAGLDATPLLVAFYEASPAPDGTRAVLYLDGHVKRERETDWARIRAASDAIAPPLNFGKRASNGKPTSATVTLYDAAAMAYMLRRGRDDKGRPQQVYLSKSTNRVYYRDAKTKQAIWLSSSEGKTAPNGITIPYEQAQEFRDFQGYSGQAFGRTFGDDVNAAVLTPIIKTALGANAALSGSRINVDTVLDGKMVTLQGTTTNNAQKALAEAIAKKYASGFRVVNELVVIVK